MSFNPLAGNFSSSQWLAPSDTYELKIMKVTYQFVGNENPKPILSFQVAIANGPFTNRRPAPIQVWEPEVDFVGAARVIVAALGYRPGKDDARFVEENPDLDLTLDSSDPKNMVIGSGYEKLLGCVFKADLDQKEGKNDGKMYQQYKMIRPLNDE